MWLDSMRAGWVVNLGMKPSNIEGLSSTYANFIYSIPYIRTYVYTGPHLFHL